MRKPDSQTFELGHWESMQISIALGALADAIPDNVDQSNRNAIIDLQHVFGQGTHCYSEVGELIMDWIKRILVYKSCTVIVFTNGVKTCSCFDEDKSENFDVPNLRVANVCN